MRKFYTATLKWESNACIPLNRVTNALGTRSWWVFWAQKTRQQFEMRLCSHHRISSALNVNSKHEWHTKDGHQSRIRKLGTWASKRSSWNFAFASRRPSKVACIQACRVWMSSVRRRRTANKQSNCMALRFHAICSHHHLSIDFVSCTHIKICMFIIL